MAGYGSEGGGATVNQLEWQKVAEERLKDAKVLLDGGRWEFAYYATGYVVECGLKSCILARMIHTGWVFEEKWDAKVCRVHNLDKLVDIAGLRDQLNDELTASPAAGGVFAANWTMASNWNSSSRYEARTEAEAKGLYSAVEDQAHGVLQWLRKYW